MSGSDKEQPSTSTQCSCCYCCFHLCCPQEEKERFAGVEYKLVSSSAEGAIFDNLPAPEVQKSFELPQERTEYAIPLQLSQQKESGVEQTVTEQPKRIRSTSEPMAPPGYIPEQQKRARSSSSPSEAVPHLSPLSFISASLPYSKRKTVLPTILEPHHEPEDWKPSLPVIKDEDETEEGKTENGSEILDLPPEIEFSLYYDIQCRTLMVHLQCIRNLPLRGKKVSLSPIVVLYLLPNREDIFQSRMIENTTSPNFNQSFEFRGLLQDEIRRQTLVFRVYSHSTKGDLLGGLGLSLSEADLFGVMCRKKIDTDVEKLKMVSRGDLLISLTYNPAVKRLHGLLLKATNLQKQDVVGLADPYVKIWLLKKGRRNQKWRSKVKRNTLIPIFNESFQFDLSEMDVKEVALEVLMMDYDRFSRNDVVGVVYIGEQVPHDTGRQHWEQIMSQPNTSISNWHSILPLTPQIERTTKKRKVSRTLSSHYADDEDD